ncbi:MAG: hypothetical protein NTV21_17810 [Planctomycetota bacterium]|nr:hypothetical protein [Planctomycetota bacterium]
MKVLNFAVTLLALASTAAAQTSLYQQPATPGGGNHYKSTVWIHTSGADFENDAIAWDDFELPTDQLVTRVRWTGTDSLAMGFQIEIYHEDPLSSVADPDLAVSDQPPISSQTVASYSQVQVFSGAYSLYEYEADLPTPIFCAANTRYHLSIFARAPTTAINWSWSQSPVGSNGATWWHRAFGTYYNITDNRAFELLTLHDPLVGSAFCVATTGCPCGNPGQPGEGCESSAQEGAALVAIGSASVAADDLRLLTLQLPTFESCLMIASTNLHSGVPFGDGRRCLAGPMQRFGVQSSGATGSVTYGPGLGAYASTHFPVAGHLIAGGTFGFQTWFRDNNGPCNHDSNISSGRQITFVQ